MASFLARYCVATDAYLASGGCDRTWLAARTDTANTKVIGKGGYPI